MSMLDDLLKFEKDSNNSQNLTKEYIEETKVSCDLMAELGVESKPIGFSSKSDKKLRPLTVGDILNSRQLVTDFIESKKIKDQQLIELLEKYYTIIFQLLISGTESPSFLGESLIEIHQRSWMTLNDIATCSPASLQYLHSCLLKSMEKSKPYDSGLDDKDTAKVIEMIINDEVDVFKLDFYVILDVLKCLIAEKIAKEELEE